MYSTIPIHWNIKSAAASPGISRVGPALSVFILLGYNTEFLLSRVVGGGRGGRLLRRGGCKKASPKSDPT
jgi:hypothetical protein